MLRKKNLVFLVFFAFFFSGNLFALESGTQCVNAIDDDNNCVKNDGCYPIWPSGGWYIEGIFNKKFKPFGEDSFSGKSIAGGHLNNGIADDLVIGAPFATSFSQNNAGAVAIFLGVQSCDATVTTPTKAIWGTIAEEYFGNSVAVGNFNGDAYDDIAVVASGNDGLGNTGSVYIYFGPFSSGDILKSSYNLKIYGSLPNKGPARVVANGDQNNDGKDDLIITTQLYIYSVSGSAITFYAASANKNRYIEAIDNFRIEGITNLAFNTSIDYLDFNGDNYDDIVIGVPYEGKEFGDGAVHILYGNYLPSGDVELSTISPKRTYANNDGTCHQLGARVSNAGDINDDGRDDLLISAPEEYNDIPDGTGSGCIFIETGKTSTQNIKTQISTTFRKIFGCGYHSHMGNIYGLRYGAGSLAAGDLNNDGKQDILIGANTSVDGESCADYSNLQDGGFIIPIKDITNTTDYPLGPYQGHPNSVYNFAGHNYAGGIYDPQQNLMLYGDFSYVPYSNPLVIIDFNGDGYQDIIASDPVFGSTYLVYGGAN